MAKKITISIDRCPIHRTFWAVSVNHPRGTGTRLTPGKCCGQWRSEREWQMTERELREAARVFEDAADDAEALAALRAADSGTP